MFLKIANQYFCFILVKNSENFPVSNLCIFPIEVPGRNFSLFSTLNFRIFPSENKRNFSQKKLIKTETSFFFLTEISEIFRNFQHFSFIQKNTEIKQKKTDLKIRKKGGTFLTDTLDSRPTSGQLNKKRYSNPFQFPVQQTGLYRPH